MKIFALSDPHLAFNIPNKRMDLFGDAWNDHPTKIKQAWLRLVSNDDIVLLPGDISWAKKFEQALADLFWLDSLPGHKIILKGNHDYWWPNSNSLKKKLPPSIAILKNNHVNIGPYLFFGSRLWDTQEYNCNDLVKWDIHRGNYLQEKSPKELKTQESIYDRELKRLKISISTLPDDNRLVRIGMCHFPPIDPELNDTRASKIFSEAGAKHVVFGHLHSLKENIKCFGSKGSTHYHLTSCDYLNFMPKLICGE